MAEFPREELRAAVIIHQSEIFSSDNQLFQQASSDIIISGLLEPFLRLTSTVSTPNFSRLVSSLGLWMPESYLGENMQRAQCLLVHGSKQDQLTESLLMLIHGLSNGIHDMQWTSTVAILKGFGILDLEINLRGFRSATINGFMEKLFGHAMTQLVAMEFDCDSNTSSHLDSVMVVVKWLLRAGQPLNTHYYFMRSSMGFCTPLQAAIQCDNVKLVKWLLDEGADPDFVPRLQHPSNDSPLEFACYRKAGVAFCMVELLLQYGASQKSDSALCLAIERGHTDIINRLLQRGVPGNLNEALHLAIEREDEGIVYALCQYGADIGATLETETGLVYEQTALCTAAATSLAMTKFILNLLGAQYPSRELSSFVTADVLLAATYCYDDTVQYLYQISPNAISVNELGITPLHVAAMIGSSLDTVELLSYHYGLNASTTAVPTPLHFACFEGHWNIANYLIQQNANINAIAILTSSLLARLDKNIYRLPKPPMHLTPLEFLMKVEGQDHDSESRLDSAAMLIRASARPIPKGVVYTTAMRVHLNLLSAALTAGASPNETNSAGENALRAAMQGEHKECEERQCQNYEVVALLLQHGAKLLGGEVVASIYIQCWSIIDILIRYGGSFVDRNAKGMTALEAAIISKEVLYIEWIFESNPGTYDVRSMCAAIEVGLYWVAERLLANRLIASEMMEVDTTALDSVLEARESGLPQQNDFEHQLETTALGLAAKVGNLDLQRKMLCSLRFNQFALVPNRYPCYPCLGADTSGPFRVQTGSPLAVAAMGRTVQAMESFSELLCRGWQPDTLTWRTIADQGKLWLAETLYDQGYRIQGPTPDLLQRLIQAKQQKLVLLLLQAGADPDGHDRRGRWSRSPLQMAVGLKDLDMVNCLLNAGADVNAAPGYSGGATALQIAAMWGYLGLAKHLLGLGADVNAAGAEISGRTALEGAAEYGRLDMLELLFSYGASVTGTARFHYVRAVMLATRRGHFAAVELLKSHGGWSKADEDL